MLTDVVLCAQPVVAVLLPVASSDPDIGSHVTANTWEGIFE